MREEDDEVRDEMISQGKNERNEKMREGDEMR